MTTVKTCEITVSASEDLEKLEPYACLLKCEVLHLLVGDHMAMFQKFKKKCGDHVIEQTHCWASIQNN